MPDETNNIPPALTAEQWAEWLSHDPEWRGQTLEWARMEVDAASSPNALIALLNAALPDGDPRKITREDVRHLDALFRLACTCGVVSAQDFTDWNAAQQGVPRVIAKLTALLQPEP